MAGIDLALPVLKAQQENLLGVIISICEGMKMKAKEHETDEKRTITSSHSNETMNVEEGRQEGLNKKSKANRKLQPTGLTVDDIAEQSAYEDDKTEVTEQVARSGRKSQA
jgi:hypothetical protein